MGIFALYQRRRRRANARGGNVEQAKQLVERLYGDRDALVGFQSFPERGSSRGFPSNRVATLEEAWPWALAQNRLRCAVSLLVNPTDGGGVRSANIAGVNALFVDIDGDVELVPPVALPHAVVQTRNGWHVYWVVHDVIMEEFAALQKRLALYYNGDPGVTNLNRALRLPGDELDRQVLALALRTRRPRWTSTWRASTG